MNLDQASNLKEVISSSLLKKTVAQKATISFGAGSSAVAVAMATKIPEEINGVGIVKKENGDFLVKIFSREKLFKGISFFSNYFGVPIKNISFQQVGKIEFKAATSRQRPVYPGISVAHHKVTAGTLGCFVKDEKGKIYVLSNNHVLANTNDAFFGDVIIQPGELDGGNKKDDTIASLSYLVPLEMVRPNLMDAAIAAVETGVDISYLINNEIAVKDTMQPFFNQKVEKYGRTTGHTKGRITALNVDIQVDYEGHVLDFQDQFQIRGNRATAFCDGGDSGSLILEQETAAAVGLLFAGTADGTTFATPINEVLAAFSVKIL